jgi:VanZ family protein
MHMSEMFTSDRERRLWLWTLIVLVAIYSTMGSARAVVEGLRERGLLEFSVSVVLLLVGVVVAVQWLRRRPRWREISVAFTVTTAYLMALVRIPHPEERTHLIEYGLVALLIHKVLLERRSHARSVPAPAVLAVAATAVLGLLDEGVQALLPSRVFDLRDIGFNAFAGLMAISASVALAWARRRVRGGNLSVER